MPTQQSVDLRALATVQTPGTTSFYGRETERSALSFLTFLTHTRDERPFRLDADFLAAYRDRPPRWGYGQLGRFTYVRTYSRLTPDGRQEDWWQTVQRCVEGSYTIQHAHCEMYMLPWNERKAQRSAQEMYDRIFNFKFTPPGRGLWMMGTDHVYQKGAAGLLSCSFISSEQIDQDFAAPFCFLMDLSMLGVGVGGDTRGAGKVVLRVPDTTDVPFVVEDSREGWVELIYTVLNSFVGKAQYPTRIDYSRVRPRGAPIRGFGGTAAGAEPLRDLVRSLTAVLLPTNGGDHRITSTQIVDVFNFVGKCVVAGGVRRSAEILFGAADDSEFAQLKRDKAALEDRRWASNNSIFASQGMDYSAVVESIATNGEPGLMWLDNARAYGRMGDPPDEKDVLIGGSNPCSEQSLESAEMCNLVETYPSHHDSLDDYLRTLKFAYLWSKVVTLLPTHHRRTNAIMMRNRRIGCSQAGVIDAIAKFGRRNFLQWCDSGYKEIQRRDIQYSRWLCVPRSVKTTSIKPGGTTPIIAGVDGGMKRPHSPFYIRHVRVQNTSPLVDECRRSGLEVNADPYAPDTSVVAFPVKIAHFDRAQHEVSIWEQFALAADLQRWWADNQVSCTITFRRDEAAEIRHCLEVFEDSLKSVALLPAADADHAYKFAPYVAIDEAEWRRRSEHIRPLRLDGAEHEVTERFCDGETCTAPPRLA